MRYLDHSARVAHEEPCRYRFTSWTTLYRSLLDCFHRDHYHTGEEVVGFEGDAGGVRIHLASGRRLSCDVLACADGIQSTARRILLPDAVPQYAGYVRCRGTVREWELAPEVFAVLRDAITYFLLPDGHILAYPIPEEEGGPAHGRAFNWVWYRNVAHGRDLDDLMTDRDGTRQSVSLHPGAVPDRHGRHLREAAATCLPGPLAAMVIKTTRPFVQAVVDVEVPRMAFGRICLLGDAAFTLRPHAAAGTAKAAEDAWQLAEAVHACGGDVIAALSQWERGQLALGRAVLARAREAGLRLQFEGTWRIGDPLPFGLYRPGDSARHDVDEQSPTTGDESAPGTRIGP